MAHEQREIHRKKRVIEYAEKVGNVRKGCRYSGVARSTSCLWRAKHRELGDEDLVNRRCVAHCRQDADRNGRQGARGTLSAALG